MLVSARNPFKVQSPAQGLRHAQNQCSDRQMENWRTGPRDCPLGPHMCPDDLLLFWFKLNRHVILRCYGLTWCWQGSNLEFEAIAGRDHALARLRLGAG